MMCARLMFACCSLAALPCLAGPLEVTAIRFWSLADATRIAVETNGEFRYRADRAHNPERIFFDLYGAKPSLNGRRVATREVGDALAKRVRIAETQPGVTRIVVDLENPVEFTASQLSNPDRLIIELRSPSQPPIGSPAPGQSLPVPSAITQSRPTQLPAAPPILRSEQPVLVPTLAIAKPAGGKVVFNEPASVPLVSPARTIQRSVAAGSSVKTARAATATEGNRSLIRALGLKINRVVIDPGHGGHDQGTSAENGLLEKDLVLDVALRLGKLIEQRMGSEVVFTRSDDTFIPLEERTAIANRNHADLFLSIHANSSPAPEVAGVEAYYLNFTSSNDALDVAARENASSEKSVYELRDLVQSISLHDKIEESREFASDIQKSLQPFAAKYISSAKDRGIRKAPFVVLIGAQMPSVLAEIGFLSNEKEANLLNRADHRQKLAEALYKGLFRYVQTLSHFQVAQEHNQREAHSSSSATQ